MKARLLASLAVGLSLTFVSACGTEELTAANFASSLEEAQSEERSVHVSGTVEVRGQTIESEGDARFTSPDDFAIQTTTTVPAMGGEMSVIMLPEAMYMKFPTTQGLPPGKSWVKITPEGTDPLSNMLGPMLDMVKRSADPRTQAKYFEAIKSLEPKGEEEVDGVQTTKYHAVVDAQKAMDALGMSDELAGAGVDLPETFESEVWVDSDDLLRRVQSEVTIMGQTTSTDMRFTDWGKDVEINPPPSDEVVDAAEVPLRPQAES